MYVAEFDLWRNGWCVFKEVENDIFAEYHAGPFSEREAAKSEAQRLNKCKKEELKMDTKQIVLTDADALADLHGSVRPNNCTLTLHQQRVVTERFELSERLGDLLRSLYSTECTKISEVERSRLRNQTRFMEGYASVLQERIEAF